MFRRAIIFTFAALFFFTPLVLWPSNFELFEFNKMMLVYLLAGLIVALWLARSIIDKKFYFKRTPLDLPILIFFVSQLLSTIFSINVHTSLWGYYSRFHGGLISTISYILLYYAFVSNITKKDIRLLTNFILGSAFVVSLYGIAEHFGIDKNLWVQDVQSRVFSTLGQPNWLSAYLVALLPLPIYLALNSKNWKLASIYYLLAISYFITILFTKSRSGIGATFIVLALIFVHYLIANKRRSRKLIIGSLLVTLIIVSAIGTPWTPNPNNISHRLNIGGPLWPEIEPFINKINLTTQVKPLDLSKLPQQRLDQLKAESEGVRYGGSDSGQIRDVVWQGAFALFKKYPLFGTGVETFGYSYYWTRPTAHNMLSEWDFLYNKAHNEYLNFLATTGALGLLSYLFLAGSILNLLFKRREPALLIGFIGILITNYFGFSVVVIGLFFFLFPAMPLVAEEKEKQLTTTLNSEQYMGLITVALILIGWWWLIITHWVADTKFNHGKQLLDAGYVGQALPDLQEAVKLYPNEPIFHDTLAEGYASAALAVEQRYLSLTPEQQATNQTNLLALRTSYMQKATDEITTAIKANPWHLNILKSKAKVELTLAQIDFNYYQSALDTLMRANELAPTDPKILYNIGLIQLQLNQNDAAKTAFQKALELKPDYAQVSQQLVLLK